MAARKKTLSARASSSDLVDQQLARYRSMRDFQFTAEPAGKPSDKTPAHGLPYVIQKHAASHLHYDFRLGWNGVLKSWAVAKGPSYFPGDRRLAIQVEDHPIQYAGFEGIIPKGQYGGGTVMVWDFGTWEPEEDVDEGLKKGQLKFSIHGKKLKGRWMLVRMKPGRKYGNSSKPSWLLIKEHDKYEYAETDTPVTEKLSKSALTKRDLDSIASEHSHTWDSSSPAKTAVTKQAVSKARPAKVAAKRQAVVKQRNRARSDKKDAEPAGGWAVAIASAKKAPLPEFVAPQLASSVDSAREGNEWIHELKLDGYRIQTRFERTARGSTLRLLTRKGLDWTHRMQDVAASLKENLEATGVGTALLDGELVVLDPHGHSSFALLQSAFQDDAKQTFTYFVFDLLHLDGHDLRPFSLLKRKEILENLIAAFPDLKGIRFSEHLDTPGAAVFKHACLLGAEGIISKRASAVYESGRSKTWLKLKCGMRQEFVVGGFTASSDGSAGVGSLLLGYFRGSKLIYAGRTGTGFSHVTSRALRKRLEGMKRATSPFSDVARENGRDVFWAKPELVAEVAFATWTADNLVRQAAFKGLREDKPAQEVVRELLSTPGQAISEARSEGEAMSTTSNDRPKIKKRASVEAEANDASSVKLTHPDKIFDEQSQLTKRLLADYYWAVAEAMLPYIAHRPLSLVRCPEGSTQPCFFQKHVNHMLPPGIEAVDVPNRKKPGSEEYITLATREALTGLAQIGVLEVHPWGSTNDALEISDRIIFDLDPDEAISWTVLRDAAKEVRERLKQVGLESFLKTTGGKGLHIVAPIKPEHEWPAVKEFTRNIALAMEKDHPERYLSKMTKAARAGKIYVDFQRNDRGATSVAPYSPRARAGAPVSMPLEWSELDARSMPRFTVTEFADWSKRLQSDPWKKLLKLKQRLKLPA